MQLSDISIHAWIQENNIRTESGEFLDFRNHLFLFQPYTDESPKQVILKAAQIGFSTLAILKSFWIAKTRGLDIIYTLPAAADVEIFAGGKINRLISQNPILQEWVKDKDRVEQKSVGDSIIYYRGTWTEKQAISHSSDLNIYDEVDSSKQSVIEQYSTRLQHSPYKFEWFFSHPSTEGTGVDKYWVRSDQKHWFITCSTCSREQYLSWPESIDPVRKEFICKYCLGPLATEDRRKGRWVKKYKDREFSGYWIPLLICPWVSAAEILDYYQNKSPDYFWNKVLGLPYIGGGNKLTKSALMANLTTEVLTPDIKERVVMGVDTGLKLDYVLGANGLFYQGEATDYDELDNHMKRWPKMIAVVDAGGDLIGSRKFQSRWKGRVFLCYTGGDQKGTDEPKWNDDEHIVVADRNKMIQLVVDEFTDGQIPLQGTEEDWYEYWMDWNNLHRIKVIDTVTQEYKGNKWVRNGRDHRAMATVYWRVGKTRFGDAQGKVFTGEATNIKTVPSINPDDTINIDTNKLIMPAKREDWRSL